MKRIVSLVLAILAVLFLYGCDSSGEKDAEKEKVMDISGKYVLNEELNEANDLNEELNIFSLISPPWVFDYFEIPACLNSFLLYTIPITPPPYVNSYAFPSSAISNSK